MKLRPKFLFLRQPILFTFYDNEQKLDKEQTTNKMAAARSMAKPLTRGQRLAALGIKAMKERHEGKTNFT